MQVGIYYILSDSWQVAVLQKRSPAGWFAREFTWRITILARWSFCS
jgi:hypothetical protein